MSLPEDIGQPNSDCRGPLVPRSNGVKAFLNMFYNYVGRFRIGGIANLDNIEQHRSEVMHFRKLCVPGASTYLLFLRNNSPHETATFACFSNIYEANLRLCKSAGRYCSDLQKWPFRIGDVALFKLGCLQAL